VKKLFNGPEAFTPDGEFILGESDVPGFWVAAGFCAHGLAGAGGMGWQMAEWIVNGEPSLDIWHMDIRRFGRQYRSQSYTLARATEVYATYYDIKYPNHERQAGRPLRLSPAYARLAELGASFGEKSGWERANWFDGNASEGDESLRPRGWAGENWSPAIHAEAMATRERAGLFDETLRRNQDDEFSLRIRNAGGRIVLDPAIEVYYTPRGSLRGVFRQYYEYGLWKVPVMRKHRQVPSPRSLVPLAFLVSVAALAPLSLRSPGMRRVLTAEVGAYAAFATAFGALCVQGRRESWRLLPQVVAVFPAFHLGYGLGMLRGWLRAARSAR
jgi:hypothetical protein